MISINASTRQFTIPGTDLTFGVEADNGTARKYFQCPRYVGDNLDVASCFVRINYRNANGDEDSYLVDDVAVDGTNVTFTWLLHPKVTNYKGQVKFVVCLVGPDLKLKWHTTVGTGQVLEGLEPDESHVEDDTADVVAALIAMVTAQTAAVEAKGAEQVAVVRSAAEIARNNAVAEVEAKRANSLASIPNDYSSLSTAVEKLARATAPGIVCDAAGTEITLTDASDNRFTGMRIFGKSTQNGVPTPDKPVEIVSVESPTVMVGGKNLLENTLPTHTSGGVTYTSNPDGSITLNGTSTSESYFIFDHQNEIPVRNVPLVASLGGGNGTLALAIGCYKTDGSFLNSLVYIVDKEAQVSYPHDATTTRSYLVAGKGRTFNNMTVYPMLRAPGTPADYEPYTPVRMVETSRPLRGIPVTSGGNYTDSNGQQWICDEIDFERGVYVQRVVRRTFNGSESEWKRGTFTSGEVVNYVYSSDATIENVNLSICSHAVFPKNGGSWAGGGYMRSGTGLWQTLTDMTLDEWKAYLANQSAAGTPLTLHYPLTNPIETPLTETELAAYRTLHTNKPNTTILNDGAAHMAVEYTADTKLYIDNKLKR